MQKFILGLTVGVVLSGTIFYYNLKTNLTPGERVVQQCPKKIVEQKQCPQAPVCEDCQKGKIEKAFLAFLVGLGIKNTRNFEDKIQKIVHRPDEAEVISFGEDKKDPEVLYKNSKGMFVSGREALKLFRDDRMTEEEIRNEYDENAGIVLNDPALYFARVKATQDPYILKKVSGLFKGNLTYIAGKKKGRVDDVEVDINFGGEPNDKGELEGTIVFKMSHNGRVHSNMTGNGSNGDILTHPEDKTTIVVRAGPGYYFHFINTSFRKANFYSDNKLVGVARLKKL
jgi:hypothetical protein